MIGNYKVVTDKCNAGRGEIVYSKDESENILLAIYKLTKMEENVLRLLSTTEGRRGKEEKTKRARRNCRPQAKGGEEKGEKRRRSEMVRPSDRSPEVSRGFGSLVHSLLWDF